MTHVTNEFMFEVLKPVQTTVATIREDMHSLKLRFMSLDQRLGIIHTNHALKSRRMDRLDTRLEIGNA